MTAFSLLRRRAIDQFRQRYTTAAVMAFFWFTAAALFVFRLRWAEGTAVDLPVVWCASVAPLLPLVAAFLGMDAISSERSSGRLDQLLVTRVGVHEFYFARFYAVWLLGAFWTLALLGFELLALRVFAPASFSATHLTAFLPALFALMLQGTLWVAVATAVSAFSRHASTACVIAIALTSALPRLGWYALAVFSGREHTFFGEIPLDAQAADIASGLVSVSTLLGYVILTALAFFLAVMRLSLVRLVGAGGAKTRLGAKAAMMLATALALSLAALASRFGATLEFPMASSTVDFSQRTLNILSESRGRIGVSAFLSRKDPRYRPTAQFLRTLKRRSEALGGARFEIFYIDPSWDLSPTRRLVREGIAPPALVFESAHRRSVLPLDGSIDERQVASAVHRLTTSAGRRRICWTRGHAESGFDDYGPQGMSDIARELQREGYENTYLDLTLDTRIPADCAVVVVAGARNDFSRAETAKLDRYLREGGRLLVLDSTPDSGGVNSLLPGWGIRGFAARNVDRRTLTGTDVIVSSFSQHPVVSALQGAQVVFDSPMSFGPSAAADTLAGIDRVEFSTLAGDGVNVYAAAAERGAAAGEDLALRPTRIIAIGDESFVLNAQLRARANANRDLFINAVAYLSGSGAVFSSGVGADRFTSGMDLDSNRLFFAMTVFVAPASLFVFMVALVWLRRRR